MRPDAARAPPVPAGARPASSGRRSAAVPAEAVAGEDAGSATGDGTQRDEVRARTERLRRVEAGPEMDAGTREWSSFDLGRAMSLLNPRSEDVVRKALRRLHIRFWHDSAAKLGEFLRRAGAPQ